MTIEHNEYFILDTKKIQIKMNATMVSQFMKGHKMTQTRQRLDDSLY